MGSFTSIHKLNNSFVYVSLFILELDDEFVINKMKGQN